MRTLWGVLLLVGTTGAVQGQGVRVAPGIAFETYRFSEPDAVGLSTVRLVSAPIGASIDAGRLRVRLGGAFAQGEVEDPDGGRASLSGPTDVQVRVDAQVVPDRVTLSARGILPTGTTDLGPDEFVVASVLASDLLPFRVRGWGSGGGLAFGATLSQRLGDVGVGIGAEWRRSGEFEPLEDSPTYRAGDQISAQVALNADVGRGSRASIRLAYRSYGDDTFDSGGLYRAGTRLEAIGDIGFPTRWGGSAALFAGLLSRGNGEYLQGPSSRGVAPSQDLLLAGALWRLPVRGGWIQPRLDMRLYRTEDGVGQGYQFGAGASAELSLGSAVMFVPSATARFGSVEGSDAVRSSFSGLEVGAAVRFGR